MTAILAVLAIVFSPIITLAGGYFTYKQATKVAHEKREEERDKVEAGAYERARQTFESMIGQLQSEVNRLQSRYDKVFEQLGHEQESSASLRIKVGHLQVEIDTLQRTIAQMRIQLATAGINLPGGPA